MEITFDCKRKGLPTPLIFAEVLLAGSRSYYLNTRLFSICVDHL
jgi:hypothetical protein